MWLISTHETSYYIIIITGYTLDANSLQSTSLMMEAAMRGANCTSGAIWGSVACSRGKEGGHFNMQLSPG